MSANVETMFYVREAPWHGLGVRVESALNSEDALVMSGLNWNVLQKPIMTTSGNPIPGYKANIRDTDNRVLGVVTDRYRVVQNSEAFAFTDALLGEGVKYETAGSLQDGRRIWMKPLALCRMARRSGFWRSCPTSTSSRAIRSTPIWYSAVPTTAAALSRLL